MTLGLALVHAPPRTKLIGPETARVVGDGLVMFERKKTAGLLRRGETGQGKETKVEMALPA